MEDEDEEGPASPFWLKSNNKSRGRSSSVFLNSTFVMILLLVIALLFMFIIIPSILRFTSQIFKPQAVKKGWDSLNLVLVLFAIFCAFLSRNNDGDSSSDQDERNRNVVVPSPLRNQNQWYDDEYADRVVSHHPLRKMPSRNSYPDLRVESTWTADGDHDDSRLIYHHQRRRSDGDFDVDDFTKRNNVRVENRSSKLFPTAPPVRSPTPLTIEKPKSKRTYRTLAPEDKAVDIDFEIKKSQAKPLASQSTIHPRSKRTSNRTPAKDEKTERPVNSADLEVKKSQVATPPPPPPPPPPSEWSPEKKTEKSDRKRGGAAKDLFTLKRKKKQRQKSVENFDYLLSNSESSLPEPPPPPPPPPRSTQSSSFQNMFSSKKKKPKLIYLSPPPPPPPPPPAISKPKTKIATEKTSRFGTIEDNTASGGESPSKIPPPPPLPPFKVPDWKFAVQGDYVRIKSIGSSGSNSPDMDDVESNQSVGEINGGESPPPQPSMFCPSPDVDTKAGNFIARFRAGLKLEKTDSIKGIGLSKLGPEHSPSP